MKRIKKKRIITIAIAFDWDECEDVCAELMLEDGIEVKKKGISYEIIRDSYPVLPAANKKVKADPFPHGRAM